MPNFMQPKPPLVYRTREAYQLAQLLYSELSPSEYELMGNIKSVSASKPLFSYVVATSDDPEGLIVQFMLQDGVVAILYCAEIRPKQVMAICKSAEIAQAIAMKGQETR